MKTLRLPACACPVPYVFGSGFHVRLVCFVFAVALPICAEVIRRAWDCCSAGVPRAGVFRSWTRAGSLRLPGVPSHAFALLHDLGRAGKPSPLADLSMLSPARRHRGPQRVTISRLTTRLQHLLPTLHEQRCRCPCKARFRLAGCAFTGRELNPMERYERFPVTSFLLSRPLPDATTTSSEGGMPGRTVRSQDPKEAQTSRGCATERYCSNPWQMRPVWMKT
jgi:hypothetical protein